MFESINHELRRLPGITDDDYYGWDFARMGTFHDHTSGVRRLTVGQNHGIRDRNVPSLDKESFKRLMPKIIEMLPGMPNPFVGHIELHSMGSALKEIRFIPKQ